MQDLVYWYAVAAVLLFVKMFAVSVYQGFYRIGNLTFKTPEDAAFVGREPAEEELPQVQRAQRVWLNDLENIPIFLALGVAYVWVEASQGMAGWWFMTFVVARYLHTFFFLGGIQPWRTAMYGIGVVCLFGICIQILMALP